MNVGETIERLINCGFTEENAVSAFHMYAVRQDWEGLEKLLHNAELIYNDYKEYPKEEV